jgi:flagellar biosynthesis protein FlhG
MEMNGLGWKRVSERRSARATPDALRLQTLVEGLANRLGESGSSKQISPERKQTRGRRVLAVGSGKGGVGKTLVSSSLALGLAEHLDHRVLAIDVDLGGANLHTGLGIKRPSFALNRFIMDKIPLKDLSTSSGFDGLRFISGASDIIGLAEFTDADRIRFVDELETFRDETIVLDLGAGSSLFNLDLFCTAHEGILVTTTEPTAVQNAYGFLRAAIYRRLRLLYQAEDGLLDMIGEATNHRGDQTDSIPNLIRRVSEFNRSAASRLEELIGQLRIGLVVNMAKTREAAMVADKLAKTVRQYLGVRLDFLGSVDFDTSVRRSVCEWRPLVVHFPTSRAARRLVSVAAKVGNHIEM